MHDTSIQVDLLVVAIGVVIVLSLLAKACLSRMRVPPLIGYLLIGFALHGVDSRWNIIPASAESVVEFLARLGVIALLFTVGLKSSLPNLLRHLRGASVVWIGNVVVSGLAGYFAARWLGFELLPSLVVGVAMTATSVGVPAAVWEQTGAVSTDEGQLFVDVAELDDMSSIVLLAILFALLPALGGMMEAGGAISGVGTPASEPMGWLALQTGMIVMGKLLLFAVACYGFARYAEKPLIRFFSHSESATDTVISLTSLAIIIAGIAGLLGFSVAIGAFFAGLAFSRNRSAVEEHTPFTTLHDLFVPFFFVGIGMDLSLSALGQVWMPALVLLGMAYAGKLIGTVGFSWPMLGWGGAWTLGFSMVPRAEITMIIMNRGLRMDNGVVTPELYSAMVLVVLGTCLLAPPILHALISRR